MSRAMFDMFSFVLLFWLFFLFFFDLNSDFTLLFFAFVCAMEMFALLAALLALPVNDGQKQRPNNELARQYNNKYNKQSETHTAHAYVRLCLCVCTYVKLAMAKIGNAF